jgi:hypothetical protein
MHAFDHAPLIPLEGNYHFYSLVETSFQFNPTPSAPEFSYRSISNDDLSNVRLQMKIGCLSWGTKTLMIKFLTFLI